MPFIILLTVFGSILLLLRLRVALWKAIFAGCVVLALLTGMPAGELLRQPFASAVQSDFLVMALILVGIIVLSGVQGATGQSQRLVQALERCVKSPRIRLVIFPALVGFLPMPGGALFSCPMLEEAASGMNLSPRRKALINYWFRHIWEIAWPLYPGYILACSLLDISLLTLMKYTFPLVILSFLTGWFFYMRDVKPGQQSDEQSLGQNSGQIGGQDASLASSDIHPASITKNKSGALANQWKQVFIESLPILITLLGAGFIGLLLDSAAPQVPSQAAFIISVFCGILAAIIQGRGNFKDSLVKVIFSKNLFNLSILVYAIFVFQDVITASGLIEQISQMQNSTLFILLIFIALPLLCGMLTGIMVGFVGACLPILLGILAASNLQAETLPLVVLALWLGNIGMLLTPLHVCFALTCDYFKVSFAEMWPKLLPALAVLFIDGVIWVGVLYLFGFTF